MSSPTQEQLLALWNKNQQSIARRKEYAQSEEGKEYNRRKAREFYERHKEEVSAKRRAYYEKNKEKVLAYYRNMYHEKKRVKEAREGQTNVLESLNQ